MTKDTMPTIGDEERESKFGYVYAVSGPGLYNFAFFLNYIYFFPKILQTNCAKMNLKILFLFVIFRFSDHIFGLRIFANQYCKNEFDFFVCVCDFHFFR